MIEIMSSFRAEKEFNIVCSVKAGRIKVCY